MLKGSAAISIRGKPNGSRVRERGRVLILALGIHPAHDDRRTSGSTPEPWLEDS
jgi:hypothetical protein